jgi:uncharacterized protein YfcZ (UPF0381/DUF406 family)
MTDAPHESPAAFEAVLGLIHLINNPSQCRTRLADLLDAKAACKATIELARKERAEADAKLAELAELAERAESLDKREREIKAREDAHEMELREAAWRKTNRPLASDNETRRRAAVAAAAESVNRPAHLSDRGIGLGGRS